MNMGFFTKRDKNGFDENGIHKETGTAFNQDGYNRYGRDISGFDTDGHDQEKFKVDGFNIEGINKYTGSFYDENGFDENGIHERTRQKFDERGINKDRHLVNFDHLSRDDVDVNSEDGEVESSMFTEEDVRLVSQQSGVDEEKAFNALQEANGDLARAILQLTL